MKNHTLGEFLACIVARELKDDDLVAFGLNAEIVLAAAFLAQKLYSPNLRIRHGLHFERGVELNPSAWTLDKKTKSHEIVEYNESHDLILNMASPENTNILCNTFFVSGLQIDRHGNTNLLGLKGNGKKFKLRGPGCVGTTSIAQLSKKYFIFTLEHSRRRLVEKVDYISSIGYDTRKEYGLSGGPLLCFTPLCVFDFLNGEMRIKSIHGHSSLEEVLEKTGFKPIIPKTIPETKEPAPDELKFLRKIDKNNILKNLT